MVRIVTRRVCFIYCIFSSFKVPWLLNPRGSARAYLGSVSYLLSEETVEPTLGVSTLTGSAVNARISFMAAVEGTKTISNPRSNASKDALVSQI